MQGPDCNVFPVQICFFAHSPEEVRHPATKPFVPPEALAAATTNATLEAVRKAAADSQKEAAGASLVDALLKAHAGDNSQLLAQLENVQGGLPGSSQVSTHFLSASHLLDLPYIIILILYALLVLWLGPERASCVAVM